jgi:hypothetical protein
MPAGASLSAPSAVASSPTFGPENMLPRSGTFEALIRGVETRSEGAQKPDFYATYADGHAKPMAIIETAILYDPSGPASGPSERALKTTWFQQVSSPSTRNDFPRIGMLNWFEWRKVEPDVGRVIDWRLAADPALAKSLLDGVPAGWLRFAGD